MSLDPCQIRIRSQALPIWQQEESFEDLMAEQLRHAPWLLLSIVVHAVVLMLLSMIPANAAGVEERSMTLLPTPQEFVIDEPEPEVDAEAEPEVEPELQAEFVEEALPIEFVDSFNELQESALHAEQWSTAIGLGGGAAGTFGGRRGGRDQLAVGSRAAAAAIQSGLEWLKLHQDEDGRWDADDFMKHDEIGEPCDGPGNPVHDIGVTGLALLAFLGDGSDMRRGPYRDVVRNGVQWLRAQQDQRGLFGLDTTPEYIYDHAIAALAMVEAYGLSEYKLLRQHAQRALGYLEDHRNEDGVWRYDFKGGENDTSVTGWCMLAYKSALDFNKLTDARLFVNEAALEASGKWFDRVCDPVTGHHGYSQRGEPSARNPGRHQEQFPPSKGEAMTAVALMCRIFLGHGQQTAAGISGRKRDVAADRVLLGRMAKLIASKPPSTAPDAIDHYYWYYGTYALYQMNDENWRIWQKALTSAVVETQRMDGNFAGSWDPAGVWGAQGGRVYSTAMLVLTLEAYYRYTRVLVR